jgi:TolB-like protein
MLGGKLPFRGDHDQAVIHQILHANPAPLMKLRADLPSGLQEIVGQALAKKPADRYQSMAEFAADLEAVADGLKPLKARPRRAPRKILGIRAAYIYAAPLVILALLFALNIGGSRDRLLGRPAPAIRLAVLPFANLSGDPQQDYFSDGMTQEMIAQLGRLHPETLSVIARSSVMRYKETKASIDEIGRELNVGYVLEGSAQREGTRVRITAELINVRDQSQLWSDSYEREMSGILALQNEVAKNVALALALKLLPSEQASLTKARPVDPEAYAACLKGWSHWYKLTPSDLDTAQKYFESALQKDPDYALAHTGAALVLTGRAQMGLAPPREILGDAKSHLLRALELDDTLVEAQFAMAGLKVWTEWDWKGGEASFRRAIELNPNDAMTRVYFSHLLFYLNRPEEALAQGARALELDPLNSLFMGIYGVTLMSLGQYDESIALCRKALRTSPNDPIAHGTLWEALHLERKYDEALEEAKAYYAGLDLAPAVEAMSAGFKTGGYSGAMRAAAETLVAISQQVYFGPWMIAYPYAAAGDKEKTLEWLEKGIEIGDLNMPYLGQPHSILKDLFGTDPRFQALLKRMNLPLTAGETR